MKNTLTLLVLVLWAAGADAQPWPAGNVSVNGHMMQTVGGSNMPSSSGYTYNTVSCYIVAHQDDWQLFMGYQAWYDIRSHVETAPSPNGAKVVLIYMTDGRNGPPREPCHSDCSGTIDYWEVREKAAMKSVHIAATSNPNTASVTPFTQTSAIKLNGHDLAVNRYKNTVSYFIRLKAGDEYNKLWPQNGAEINARTADNNYYRNYDDVVTTIAAIYNYECNIKGDVAPGCIPWVNIQDPNDCINEGDHGDHKLAGIIGFDADVYFLAHYFPEGTQPLPVNLWRDYNAGGVWDGAPRCGWRPKALTGCADSTPGNRTTSQYLEPCPQNLSSPDIQNKTALWAAYEAGMMHYRGVYEYDVYTRYMTRSYNRLGTTSSRDW